MRVGEVVAPAVTLRLTAVDVPPPGVTLFTVMRRGPALARSAAESVTTNWVVLRYAVGRGEPFTEAVEAATKPVPVIVMDADEDPADTVEGDRPVTAGAGFTTVNVTPEVVWDPVTTATASVPEAANCEAVMVPVSDVELT